MNIYGMTDVGRVRDINQDQFEIIQLNESETLVILCDGMGGHNAGEVASEKTIQYIKEHFNDHGRMDTDLSIKNWMRTLLVSTNDYIERLGDQDAQYKDMGTTIVLVYIVNDTTYISHVGDSRCYFYNDDLIQITEDDTLVNALVREGYITEQEASIHPNKNVLTQAIGVTPTLSVSFYIHHLKHGHLLLCSDGLYNSISEELINTILHYPVSTKEKCETLIRTANLNGGFDNITVILIEGGLHHE